MRGRHCGTWINKWWRSAAMLLVSMALPAGLAHAQATAQDSEKEIERYRAMISDPFSNPGFLNVDRGEILWRKTGGTNNVSLEACDLGLGAGNLSFLVEVSRRNLVA